MGVAGLHPLLKSIQRSKNLDAYKGMTIGVDAYGWLHRGAHPCAVALAQGLPTKAYLRTAIRFVKLLLRSGVKPLLVFDGDYLPSKASVEAQRADKRAATRKAGLDLLAAGNKAAAFAQLQQCINITPQMARELIAELDTLNVPYVVAPYEADAQLVFLERHGIISGILSEDSDLLVFGAKRLLSKLDQDGSCIEINRRDFAACREVSLAGWTDTDFRRMAILSGCDYYDGIPGVGLKTAHMLIRKYKTPERLLRMMELDGKYRIPANFLKDFYQAEMTFLHQRVYCPVRQALVLLTEPPTGCSYDAERLPFIGAFFESDIARAVARGHIDPMSKLPIPHPKGSLLSPVTKPMLVASTSIGKGPPSKPIDSYFNNHQRVPMGEMDSNCFSIDKKRLSAITQNGLSSVVFPLPRPYLETSNSFPSPTGSLDSISRQPNSHSSPLNRRFPMSTRPRTVPPSLSRTIEDAEAMLHFSSSRPPKKARLCEDAQTLNDDGAIYSKSKYFSPRQAPQVARRTKSESYLWSDDSIDQVLAELPDINLWPVADKGRDSFGVYEDKPTDPVGELQVPSESSKADALSHPDEACIINNAGTPLLPSSPSTLDADQSVPLALHLQTPICASIQRFTYAASSSASCASPRSSASSCSTLGCTSAIFTPASTSSTAGSTPPTAPSTASPRRRSHLEILGERALARSRSHALPSPSLLFRPPHRRLPPGAPSAAAGRGKTLPEPRFPVNPAFVPLPPVSLAEVAALNRPSGSEDLLAPMCSDEEAEMGESRQFNLSRFMYL